ncbi:outer membrane protein assembly factor BamE [Bacterioplanoides sp. SCSIO 12839]|uniref:outer membrane protein assembly factor BamE n=1 Tax=Bacterioplanoides sp. SCSIO 12839 TaxID=2829569 RepID=UPI002106DF50|nr:outer membrane protein assembly factor BamE [Bacterioplanoides sp. SCSIO 12839]UTW47662.1 outer membrane protein assembly factor BamE [Bacterioplanoides sp. SCSIO 12839]
MRASILTVLLGIATLAGCAFPGVYKLNVQQGNIVTDDMLAQLETGMTQRQVEYVMGTPVVKTPYQQQRWDYLYSLEQNDEVTKRYHIRVYFDEQGIYTHYEGQLPVDPLKEKKQQLPAEEEQEKPVKAEGLLAS